MLGSQGGLLLGEPPKRDLGFTPSPRSALDLFQVLSILGANGAVELCSVGSKHAAESANRDPKIMERFAIEAIVQPPLRSHGCAQAFEREAARGFLFAAPQEVIRQCAATPRLQLRDLRNRFSLTGFGTHGGCGDRGRISWLAGDERLPGLS